MRSNAVYTACKLNTTKWIQNHLISFLPLHSMHFYNNIFCSNCVHATNEKLFLISFSLSLLFRVGLCCRLIRFAHLLSFCLQVIFFLIFFFTLLTETFDAIFLHLSQLWSEEIRVLNSAVLTVFYFACLQSKLPFDIYESRFGANKL